MLHVRLLSLSSLCLSSARGYSHGHSPLDFPLGIIVWCPAVTIEPSSEKKEVRMTQGMKILFSHFTSFLLVFNRESFSLSKKLTHNPLQL